MWFGLESIPIPEGLSPRILLVPLPGHTPGHCGVAVESGPGWLFHVGDAASPYHRAVDVHGRRPEEQRLNWIPAWVHRRLIGPHVSRLRTLLHDHGDRIEIISGHDVFAFARFRGQVLGGEA
jgi:glyoxylase-like metal-dependent hydrolase (beta-lactamase superfamily II)